MDYLFFVVFAILCSKYNNFLLLTPLLFLYVFKNNKKKSNLIFKYAFIFVIIFVYSFARYEINTPTSASKGIVYEKNDTASGKYKYYVINGPINRSVIFSKNGRINEGDYVICKGENKEFNQNSMPFLFNEKDYYNGIGINGKVINADINKLGNSFLKSIFNLKIQTYNRFKKLLNNNAFFMSSGVVLRMKEDSIIYDKMQFLGLSHILSTSGLHVAIIYGFIFLLLGFIENHKIRTIFSCIFIWLYGLMLFFPPSLLRAIIMISTIELGKIYMPNTTRLDAFWIAFGVSLIVNPYFLFNAGFLLSYICVYGILVIAPELRKNIINKTFIKEMLNVNIAIIIATFPVVLYFFNRFNVLTVVWNMIFVPVFSVYINLSFLLFLVAKLPIVSTTIAFILNIMANIINYALSLSSIKYFNLFFPSPNIIGIILYYSALLIYLNREYLRLNFYKESRRIFVILCSIFVIAVYFTRDQDFVQFLDVGQGDSSLLHINGKNYLVDSGGSSINPNKDNVAKNILEPYLIKNGFRNIEAVFISHFDIDHCGALRDLEDINIKYILSDHHPKEKFSNFSDRDMKVVKETGILKPQMIPLGNKYYINPIEYEKLSDENNSSFVFTLNKSKINYVLYTGDIEKEGEKNLMNNNIRSYILKVAHHGSKSGTTEEFVKKVSPKYSVISVGRNNVYGHPNDEILKRLEENSQVFRTDRDGLITFYPDTLEIYTFNGYNGYLSMSLFIILLVATCFVLKKGMKNDGLY